ncbi:MAG: hypothetical protein HC888_08830 [Candidatus Competibacteraceae bacterium]|nr:hypothetical protein [Candidatus Competibacteraceae bacterium]
MHRADQVPKEWKNLAMRSSGAINQQIPSIVIAAKDFAKELRHHEQVISVRFRSVAEDIVKKTPNQEKTYQAASCDKELNNSFGEFELIFLC